MEGFSKTKAKLAFVLKCNDIFFKSPVNRNLSARSLLTPKHFKNVAQKKEPFCPHLRASRTLTYCAVSLALLFSTQNLKIEL